MPDENDLIKQLLENHQILIQKQDALAKEIRDLKVEINSLKKTRPADAIKSLPVVTGGKEIMG